MMNGRNLLSETRYIVAKTHWHAKQLLKRVYQGRLKNFDDVLLKTQHQACKKMQKLPLGVQELYSSFQVKNFNPKKIDRYE